MKYSANLGLLWTELKIDEAIHQAKKNNFDAIELWFPYNEDPNVIKQASDETNLPILCLNTSKGDEEKGEFGLCALPDKKKEAKEAIKNAVDYADKIGCQNSHLLAGKTDLSSKSLVTLIENIKYARDLCEPKNIGVLV